jgi:hypothetical protein
MRSTIGIGHNNPPAATNPAPWLAGAHALIQRRKRPVGTAGRAHENDWVLSFERRTPPEIDELMGWTGGDDMLATEVRLTFATCEEAVAYAERQGLDYRVEPEPTRNTRITLVPPRHWSRSGRHAVGRPLMGALSHQSLSVRVRGGEAESYSGLPDLDRALVNPAAVFAEPKAVLQHPRLMRDCKGEILRRWAWDEYLKDLAASEGMAEGEPSRLDEVKAALLALGEVWRPKPSAPAAAVPLLQHDLKLIAA